MRRHTHIGILVCLLSIWMQTLVPAALAARAAFDPFAIICHHTTTGDDAPSAPVDHSGCEHCVLCHATLAGLDGTPAPDLPALERYASAIFAWPTQDVGLASDRSGLAGRPRGPPTAA